MDNTTVLFGLLVVIVIIYLMAVDESPNVKQVHISNPVKKDVSIYPNQRSGTSCSRNVTIPPTPGGMQKVIRRLEGFDAMPCDADIVFYPNHNYSGTPMYVNIDDDSGGSYDINKVYHGRRAKSMKIRGGTYYNITRYDALGKTISIGPMITLNEPLEVPNMEYFFAKAKASITDNKPWRFVISIGDL